MRKIKIFISSVQVEMTKERWALHEYLLSDPLLGKFFEPFLFELLPASDQNVANVYLREVELCDIYLGILGNDYGFEDAAGISPTEREFDHATLHHKTRLVFLKSNSASDRHPKQNAFINKVQSGLVRKSFCLCYFGQIFRRKGNHSNNGKNGQTDHLHPVLIDKYKLVTNPFLKIHLL